MNAGKLVGRVVARNIVARRSYGGGAHHRAPTMNDMPVPQGDFFMLAAKRQGRHNAILALGLGVFSTTIWIAVQSKLINLNWSPPATYE